jgi:hypothetical protein
MFRRKGPGPADEPAVREDPKPVVLTRVTPLDGVILPPFSADRPRCVKCNGTRANTTYMAANACCNHWGSPGGRFVYGQERMHRRCGVCDWEWDERCYEPKETVSDLGRRSGDDSGDRVGEGRS